MERASRAELINTVNTQRDQLQQYKVKLRDVVAAYKSVVKEKEALEASVSALTSSPSASVGADHEEPNGQGGLVDTPDGGDGQQPDPLGVNKQDGKDELQSLKDQMKTLSAALTTLTQEKNKVEANFIADKKQLRQDNEELQAVVAEERKRTSKQAEGFELQITNLKSRIRTQQLERDQEQTAHALMLRELQSLMAKERTEKETLETKLEEAQQSLESLEKAKAVPAVSEVYEKQIQQLQHELKTVRDRLRNAEVQASQPSPFMLELQKEMASMKLDYQSQVEREQQKAMEAESRLRSQSRQSEERVSSLEAKLSELSDVVGNYERLRFQDQQAISKLRERVSQLDMENSALARAASLTPERSEEEDMEPGKLLEKILKLRTVLKANLGKADNSINLAEIFVEDLNKSDEESPQCRKYKEELEQVKEEFERYKLRAQSVLKNKNKESSVSKETELLKDQVAEMRDKLRMANFHHQEDMEQLQGKIDNLSKALLAQEERAKVELAQVKATHQHEISQLELEFKKQRSRTVALLSEKDAEILALRGQSPSGEALRQWVVSYASEGPLSPQAKTGDPHFQRAMREDEGGQEGEGEEEKEAVSRLLDLPKGVHNEAAFLHFAQEKSRMEVELSGLRKQKRQMEMSLREHQLSASQTVDGLKDEVSSLREQLDEVDRTRHREDANVEYLKNVLVKFLTSTDYQGKKQMLKALMTILQFSPAEKEKVFQLHKGGWWPSS